MKNNTIENCRIIEIPKVHDERGSLAVIEKGCFPFEIKRVYYLYDVPSDAFRGGHAHKNLNQLLIPLSGSFEVLLKDGTSSNRVLLNKPNKGLLIVPGIWREIDNFSSGSVCLVLASEVYDETDYLRDFNEFQSFKG
ncbi:sugar 3,4-ketoisomerase [Winogradskyella ursingii]|uniref:sugar 3,4-ketoisomerase n=1 Tax=Winogradskyella ursingii TaxID=2686079 RepID=UPI0015C9E438|nr:FdtA/QdtA family cupin domain-containing protein [Winogradskyella ursingii]